MTPGYQEIQRRIFSVSELTSRIKSLLETQMEPLWVTGEISNFTRHSSGHLYFSLKDAGAQLRCVMFRFMASKLNFEPSHGMMVRAFGCITVFEIQGQYQLRVENIEPVGVGALNEAFERLKQKLNKEGLFDKSLKKKIPAFPKRIGIVTSETGAAIRDLVTVISRRYPLVRLLLYPARVQGDGASTEIIRGIEFFNNVNPEIRPDVIIIGRGGGSQEDLWAFNDEVLARTIVSSRIPIISAVGHEIDFTISDFAADIRAPTPSAAGEIAVPDMKDLKRSIDEMKSQIVSETGKKLELLQLRYRNLLSSGLFRPERTLQERMLRLDLYAERIEHQWQRLSSSMETGLKNMRNRIIQYSPAHRLTDLKSWIEVISLRLYRQSQAELMQTEASLQKLASKLHGFNLDYFRNRYGIIEAKLTALNPRAILKRGYAICSSISTGHIVTDSRQVEIAESVGVELGSGKITCEITERSMPDDIERK